MSWLERNGLKIEPTNVCKICNYCNHISMCLFYIKFKGGRIDYFCSKEHVDQYCNQMKDRII